MKKQPKFKKEIEWLKKYMKNVKKFEEQSKKANLLVNDNKIYK
jgi:hypothetical protein